MGWQKVSGSPKCRHVPAVFTLPPLLRIPMSVSPSVLVRVAVHEFHWKTADLQEIYHCSVTACLGDTGTKGGWTDVIVCCPNDRALSECAFLLSIGFVD